MQFYEIINMHVFIVWLAFMAVYFFFVVKYFLYRERNFKKEIEGKSCEQIFCYLSFTLLYASYKKYCSPNNKANIIRKNNRRYFRLTFAISIIFALKYLPLSNYFPHLNELKNCWYFIALISLFWFYAFSRVNEIFFAFIRDATDKLKTKTTKPRLKSRDLMFYGRIKLAMVSYIELIFLYGILQFILSFYESGINNGCDNWIANIGESIYFSGITIATVGYGDLSPKHGLSQFLAVYEVINGLVLIVVSFTIYVSRSIVDGEYENDASSFKSSPDVQMKTVTLKIDNAIYEKFCWLLAHFSKTEIQILEQSDDE
jgi:voltage-gated potassium channel